MESVVRRFQTEGEFREAVPFGNGHIHETYRVGVRTDSGERFYILQKINTGVFPFPRRLMDNILKVTGHLRKRMAARGITDLSRRVLRVIPTVERGHSHVAFRGEWWRMYNYIDNSVSYDVLPSPETACRVARCYGAFLNDLRDLSPDCLPPTIPHFHDAPRRLNHFRSALKTDSRHRAEGIREEIDFLLSRADRFDIIPALVGKNEIPRRITHNDTKLNNVLFDRTTGESLSVIDLDTVMSGTVLFDFGDLARSTLVAAAEDERELSRIQVRLPVFEALLRGFLSPVRRWITPVEVDLLVHSVLLMPAVIGMRFLTDYLEGDIYFKTSRPDHNLSRARVQFALVRSAEKAREEMREILQRVRGDLC